MFQHGKKTFLTLGAFVYCVVQTKMLFLLLHSSASSYHQFYLQKSNEFITQTKLFQVSLDADSYNMSVHTLKSIRFSYKPFNVSLPNFFSDSHRNIFTKTKGISDVLLHGFWLNNGMDGSISVFENATFEVKYECGYKENETRCCNPQLNSLPDYYILCPLLVPDGCSFQHFTDGVLPKLMQGYSFLMQNKDAKLLVNLCNARFPFVKQLYNLLGFEDKRLVTYQKQHLYSAKFLVNLCDTPPVHPYLWQKAQHILGVKTDHCGNNVIWLSRNKKNSFNGGRLIKNEADVLTFLRTKFGRKLIVFDASRFIHISSVISIFQNASIIIGPHGGAFFNQLFSPKYTVIIEIMPTDFETGAIPLKHPGVMVWMFAHLLLQHYWRLPSKSVGKDTSINITELSFILKQAEKQACLKNNQFVYKGPLVYKYDSW